LRPGTDCRPRHHPLFQGVTPMQLTRWKELVRKRSPRTTRIPHRKSHRPHLEALETRTVPTTTLLVGPDINITKSTPNEAETSIALNPTNPNNLFAIDTLTLQGRFSTDGGATWTNSNMAGFAPSGDTQAIWDRFGNLFVADLTAGGVEVGISSNGGSSFSSVQTIAGSGGSDQPSLASGPSGLAGVPGAVWVTYTNSGGNIVASGAAVNGLGLLGAFSAPET